MKSFNSKKSLFILSFILSSANLFAQTDIQNGPVSGIWEKASSPYRILGDIEIPDDSTLTIEPGVVIQFQGHYELNVKGVLNAIGAENDSIYFTVNDTTGFSQTDSNLGAWEGIRIIDPDTTNDSTRIVYCRLEFAKAFGDVWHINSGGAICITQFNKIRIENCLFSHNQAISTSDHMPVGGGLYFFKSDIIIKNNSFVNNRAHSGGAVFFDESEPYFSSNTFKHNFAYEGAAAAVGGTSYPVFENDSFIRNVAEGYGGALMFWQPSIVKVNNILFQDNTAIWGAAIGVGGGELQANNCQFLGNKAELWGGAIACDFGTLVLNNCSFNQNSSQWGSGALHTDHAIAEVSECDFVENSAVFGAGFHGVFSQVSFIKTEFSDNQADGGAGAHIENCDLILDDCLIEQNQAINGIGGAIEFRADSIIYSRPYLLNITRSRFVENRASASTAGIFIEQTNKEFSIVDLVISGCDFIRNHADVYGALRIGGNISDFIVSNCLFSGNTTKRWVASAGFIADSRGQVNNCVFTSNYTSYSDSTKNAYGAAVASRAQVDFFNCVFTDTSQAGGTGISLRNNSRATVTNSIFWGCGNRPLSIVTINENGSKASLNYCTIENGIDSIFISDSLSTLNWGVGNISSDPLFVDAQNMDYHLQDKSPCIGAGINCLMINQQWYCCPTSDMEGIERPLPAGSNADMGAYEHALAIPTSLENIVKQKPNTFALKQNYPNPFNPKTIINYELPITSDVKLTVYDMLGQKVATLISKKQSAGSYKVDWDASDFSSGIYFYKLETDQGFTQTRKMIVLK